MGAETRLKEKNITLPRPFPRMDHADAMERYGTDKPDIRFAMEFVDVQNLVKDSSFALLANAAVVSFYELVFDEWELRHQIAGRLPAEVIDRVHPLWEWRLPGPRMAEAARLMVHCLRGAWSPRP